MGTTILFLWVATISLLSLTRPRIGQTQILAAIVMTGDVFLEGYGISVYFIALSASK